MGAFSRRWALSREIEFWCSLSLAKTSSLAGSEHAFAGIDLIHNENRTGCVFTNSKNFSVATKFSSCYAYY